MDIYFCVSKVKTLTLKLCNDKGPSRKDVRGHGGGCLAKNGRNWTGGGGSGQSGRPFHPSLLTNSKKQTLLFKS